ncbi:MAG: hypothetical protein JNJ88_00230 [Planctomycetes bacterium]|nr:hypothetical protein [Planctomycetota bacterium]
MLLGAAVALCTPAPTPAMAQSAGEALVAKQADGNPTRWKCAANHESAPRLEDATSTERLRAAMESAGMPAVAGVVGANPSAAPKNPPLPATTPMFTARGTAIWKDSLGGLHGIPDARVRVYAKNTLLAFDTELTTAPQYTGAGGEFEVLVSHPGGTPTIYVAIESESRVAVVQSSLLGSIYSLESAEQGSVAAGTTVDVGSLVADAMSDGSSLGENPAAFSVHHALVVAGYYTSTIAGAMAPKVTVKFPLLPGDGTSKYKYGSLWIEWGHRYDWDVIQHEYGHHVSHAFGLDSVSVGTKGHKAYLTNAPTAGKKGVGVQIAITEGWASYFAVMAQLRMGSAALGIPNVGDLGFTNTQSGYVYSMELVFPPLVPQGEADEAAVFTALWDLADSSPDEHDSMALGDAAVFSLLKTAKPSGMADVWNALTATSSNAFRAAVGGVFTDATISPRPILPKDNATTGSSTEPPTFAWEKGNGPGGTTNDRFRIRFFSPDFSSVIAELPDPAVDGMSEIEATTFKPKAESWQKVLSAKGPVRWVVLGRNNNTPATPGEEGSYYWSSSRLLLPPTIALVVDDTGSMGEEIAGVKAALQQMISEVNAAVSSGEPAPTMALITFKDSVTTRIVSNDLNAVAAQVGALYASGGGDCPEFGASALAAAGELLGPGGVIVFATDAASHPSGPSLGSVISDLLAKGITVHSLLSGDCASIMPSLLPDETALPGDSPNGIAESDESASTADETDGGGSSDPPIAPIDEYGNSAANATGISVQDAAHLEPMNGLVGGSDDPTDWLHISLEPGQGYRLHLSNFSTATLRAQLIASNGVTVLGAWNLSGGSQAAFPFMTATAGKHYLVFSNLGGSTSKISYQFRAALNPYFSLDSLQAGIAQYSTISSLTKGAFVVADGVNSGSPAEFQATALNAMLAAIKPTVVGSSITSIPRGVTIPISLVGSGSNWKTGSVVSFGQGALPVQSVVVYSATELTAWVEIPATAALGTYDVRVTTPLGAGTEIAEGKQLLKVVSAAASPSIVSVAPFALHQASPATILIDGLATTWTSASTLSLGIGVTVQSVSVLSPTQIQAQLAVSSAASIGYRTAVVSTSGKASQVKTRAVFVYGGFTGFPALKSIDPSAGSVGQTVDVLVAAENTHFISGVTGASSGQGIEVLSVSVLDPTHAVVRLHVRSDAALGFRGITLWTGDEFATLPDSFYVSTPPLDLIITKGLITDYGAQKKDRVTIAGSYTFNVQSEDGIVDWKNELVSIGFGPSSIPTVVQIPPGSSRWKQSAKGLLQWTSEKGSVPQVSLKVNPTARTFVLKVTKLDLAAPAENPVTVSISVGNDSGTLTAPWIVVPMASGSKLKTP